MEITESGLHGFRTLFRKMERLNTEERAKLYALLVPNPVFILGGKAEYDTLPESQKQAWDAGIVSAWIAGMEEALRLIEQLTAEKTVRILPDQTGEAPGNHDRNRFQEKAGIHPRGQK